MDDIDGMDTTGKIHLVSPDLMERLGGKGLYESGQHVHRRPSDNLTSDYTLYNSKLHVPPET